MSVQEAEFFVGNIAFINSFENLVPYLIKFPIKETNSAIDC